ncbi:unnamed protein product [Diatraea saccharalis]|uniref:Uncharacterized protein n=1 Tax=Diatraea saccharalis TaxID=40085 RepID=A0A9N9RE84_9NEOP|nr:unnamed protein product [Diatraea saccharalis]
MNNKECISNTFQHLPNAINSGPNSLQNNCNSILVSQSNVVKSPQRQRANTPAPTVTSPAEERRMYSPVTFQDVARRSIANSPNRTEKEKGLFEDSRSNSTSFGVIWTDAESVDQPKTTDSLDSTYCYSATSPFRVGTAPPSKERQQDSFVEKVCLARMSPAHSAPPLVDESCTTLRSDTASTNPHQCGEEQETDVEYEDGQINIIKQPHVCTISDTVDNAQIKQGKVGRFKAKIAPGNQKSCQKQPQKDSVKEKCQSVQSNVQPHGHHHTKNVNHHQCCGAFGNPHVRHKSSNSSCSLV